MRNIIDNDDGKPVLPVIKFRHCPIIASLGVLGKKWTLLILRDLVFMKIDRFNEILRSLPGLTPRVLTMRLGELKRSGLIEPVIIQHRPRIVRWTLTQKGRDTIPVLMSLLSFGAKYYSDVVFEDGMPRKVKEMFPDISTIRMN